MLVLRNQTSLYFTDYELLNPKTMAGPGFEPRSSQLRGDVLTTKDYATSSFYLHLSNVWITSYSITPLNLKVPYSGFIPDLTSDTSLV